MKLEEMKQVVEFLSFDKDPNEKVFGYIRIRLNRIFIVIFPVIQKKDGDLYVANPSKSINVMGQWRPSEMAFFEQKEDRDNFANLAKDFVWSKTNGNGTRMQQNTSSQPYPHVYQQNPTQAKSQSPAPNQDFRDVGYSQSYNSYSPIQ